MAFDLACRAVLPKGELVQMEDDMRAHVESAAAPDVEVIGDSVARSGFLASALADAPLTAGNVSTPASGTPKSYLLLAQQFESGRVPKALVIAHSPHTFGQVRYEVLVGGFAHWSEIPGLALEADPWTDVLYGLLTRLSYVAMHRDSFRELLTRGDPGFFLAEPAPSFLPSDLERVEAFARRVAADDVPREGVLEPSDFAGQPFVVEPMNDRYFRKIFELAKAHGVKVFWVTMPTPASAYEARSQVRYEEEMLRYLRQFETSGDLHILRGEFVVYPDHLFRDWLHLNEAGAVRLACELQALKAPVLAAASEHGRSVAPSPFTATLAPLCDPTSDGAELRRRVSP